MLHNAILRVPLFKRANINYFTFPCHNHMAGFVKALFRITWWKRHILVQFYPPYQLFLSTDVIDGKRFEWSRRATENPMWFFLKNMRVFSKGHVHKSSSEYRFIVCRGNEICTKKRFHWIFQLSMKPLQSSSVLMGIRYRDDLVEYYNESFY